MINIRTSHELKDLINNNSLVFVDFYADWCPPCKQISPYLESLANKNQKIKFAKVNVDQCNELANEYKVSGIPHFVAIHNGQQIDSQSGASEMLVNQLVSKLESKM